MSFPASGPSSPGNPGIGSRSRGASNYVSEWSRPAPAQAGMRVPGVVYPDEPGAQPTFRAGTPQRASAAEAFAQANDPTAVRLEMARPSITLDRFARMTGLSLKLRILVALTVLAVVIATTVFLLASQPGTASQSAPAGFSRNIPLFFLMIVASTTLLATWVSIPIVRPIRRATRELLATTEHVHTLARRGEQIASDQRQGTELLTGAVNGLNLRRQGLGREAHLIVQAAQDAAPRFQALAQILSDPQLPMKDRMAMQQHMQVIYHALEVAHQSAGIIVRDVEQDPLQKRFDDVMAGAEEIKQQFEQASSDLQQGVAKLEKAARALQ